MGRWREYAACSARMRAVAALCLVCLVLAGGISQAAAFGEEAVKAVYLNRFASYVYWPSESQPSAQLVIGVFGADGVADELERLLPQPGTQHRPTVVRKVEPDNVPGSMHILYVGPGRLAEARDVLRAVERRPVLVVTDDDNGLARGGTINFVRVNRNVRFEISLETARRSGLQISAGLLSVAARVEAVN